MPGSTAAILLRKAGSGGAGAGLSLTQKARRAQLSYTLDTAPSAIDGLWSSDSDGRGGLRCLSALHFPQLLCARKFRA
jgi:hypothetical protein